MTGEEGLEGVIQIRRTPSGYQLLHIRGGTGGSVGEEVVIDGTLGDVHGAIDRLYEGEARHGAVEERTAGGLEGIIRIRCTASGYQVLHGRPGIGDSVAEDVVVDGTLEDVHRAIDRLHEAGPRQRAELGGRVFAGV